MKFGELLVSQNKISARDLERGLLAQTEMGDMLGRVLIRLGLLSELDVAKSLSEHLGVPLIEQEAFPESLLEVPGLSQDFINTQNFLPYTLENGTLTVVTGVPQDSFLARAIHLATGLSVTAYLGVESEIQTALTRYFSDGDAEKEEDGNSFDTLEGKSDFIEHLRDLASEAPVIRLVNQVIAKVVDLRASDIHIEPFEDNLQIRYRIDGVLQQGERPAQGLGPAVTSRLKLLANLNIAERRLPQDGRIKMRVKGRELDLRVSTLPTVYGESVVMRVLDRASIRLNLEDMGFSPDLLENYRELLLRPHGIILMTGPTGSGKTTTLYASLAKIDSTTQKVVTVEDPVEYQLDGVNQVQVQPQIGLTFAHALRSILRQDPDIIMIGEMRDTETAQIAVQSALTGHLVLSTLHTNTAAGAIIRLEDMGVERYLITSTVNGVVAQRLLRCLCTNCKVPTQLPPDILAKSGLARFLAPEQTTVYKPGGCPQCKNTGYKGRTAIHELFVMNDAMHEAILSGADATTLHNLARKNGMHTLYEDGLRKVAEGVSSLDEVMRVTQDQGNG